VALAQLILEEPNVLVLDEPTNHLDIASREALQTVLSAFGGTLLFVSHDRYLIDRLSNELWVVADGRLIRYAGNYTSYGSGQARPLDAPDRSGSAAREGGSPEARVQRLEGEAEALTARLAESTTASLGQLAELTDRYEELLRELDDAEDEWLQSIRKQLRASSA
jgi:ATP-binding cassette subfamily F protein 3